MKTIIAGSRTIVDIVASIHLQRCIRRLPWTITEVVSGRAQGVDRLGEQWAGTRVPVKPFPARWHDGDGLFDRGAGHKRNRQMAEYVGPKGGLLALWDGESTGTRNMIETARKLGLRVVVEVYLGDGLDC